MLKQIFMFMSLMLFAYPTLQSTHNLNTATMPVLQESGLRLVDVQPVSELTDEENVFLSPDATRLAWLGTDELICIVDIETTEQTCVPAPESLVDRVPLRWSPDSRYVAVHEDLVRRFNEPDIWVFDTTTSTFTNLTDDGISPSGLGDETADMLDTRPVWHPVSGDLYFFRAGTRGDTFTTMLYRIPRGEDGRLAPDSAEQVTAFAAQHESPVAVYDIQAGPLKGSAAFSPDGSQIAFISRTTNQPFGDIIWLLDLEDESIELVVNWADIVTLGKPGWYSEEEIHLSDMPGGLGWTADGDAFVVLAVNGTRGQESLTPGYRIAAATGEVTTLMDFSGIESIDALFTERNAQGRLLGYDRMIQSVRLPGTNTMVYMNPVQFDSDGTIGYSALDMTETDAEPLRLVDPEEDLPFYPLGFPTAGANESVVRALIAGNLLTFERTDEAGLSTVFDVRTSYTPLEVLTPTEAGYSFVDVTSLDDQMREYRIRGDSPI